MASQRHQIAALLISASLFLGSNSFAATTPVADSSWDTYHNLASDAANNLHWNKAEQMYRLCLKEAEDTGADPNKMVSSLQGLAETLTQLDRVKEALPFYKQAYEILAKAKGANDRSTINARLDLASCYESQGNNKSAEAIYNQVLTQAGSGPDSESTGHAYYRAAQHYAKKAKLAKSEELYKSAMPHLEKAAVLSPTVYARFLKDYQSLLNRNNKIEEAASVQKKLNDLVLQNPAVLTTNANSSSNNINRGTGSGSGLSTSATGGSGSNTNNGTTPASSWGTRISGTQDNTDSSQENISEKLVSRAEIVGTGSLFSTLSEVSASQKRYDEAEPLYKKVIEIDEQSLGPDHPGTAADLTNLAQLYLAQNKTAEALPLFQRAMTIYQKSYGQNNLAVVECKLNLGILYDKQGNAAEAEKYYKEALSGSQNVLGNGKFLTAKILNRLGFFYFRQSRYSEAEATYIKALASSEDAVGPNSRLVGACCRDYARVLKAENKTAEAEKLEARAQDIFAMVGSGS